jgi:hypothetical protein
MRFGVGAPINSGLQWIARRLKRKSSGGKCGGFSLHEARPNTLYLKRFSRSVFLEGRKIFKQMIKIIV